MEEIENALVEIIEARDWFGGARRRWRNIVKNNLKRRVKVWIVFIWHVTHSVGGLLLIRQWNC